MIKHLEGLIIIKKISTVKPTFLPSDTHITRMSCTWFIVGLNTVIGTRVGSLLTSLDQHDLFYDACYRVEGNFHVCSWNVQRQCHWSLDDNSLCCSTFAWYFLFAGFEFFNPKFCIIISICSHILLHITQWNEIRLLL